MYSINKKFLGWEEKKFTWRAAKLLPLHAALANPMQAALNDVVLAGKLSKPLFCLEDGCKSGMFLFPILFFLL